MARPGFAEDPSQLSLFDPAPPPAAATGAGVPASPGSVAPSPPPPRHRRPPAPVPEPAAPPLLYAHPRGDREVRLGEHRVTYALRRARRRSIGFVVSPEGLAVSAPRWVSIGEIDSALQAKATWILRKLHEQRERARRIESARVQWCDGTTLPFLGETLIVVLDPRVAGVALNTDGRSLPGLPRLTLHVGLPQGASGEQIRDLVQSWLQRQALEVFKARCAHFAAALDVSVRRLSLSAAQTRWGSASADGSIRLNWRLVHFGLKIIDYVVAHELAHLREMNHSPAFWDVVRSVVPDFEQVRGALKDEALPVLG